MTDLETAIMIKNMARETVRRMTAKVKNADDTKDKVRALLVKWGNNPADVDKLLAKNYEWAASRYDSVRTIAEAVRTVTTKNAAEEHPYLEAIKGKIAAEGYKNPTEAEIKKIFANVAAPMQMIKFALEYKRRGLL